MEGHVYYLLSITIIVHVIWLLINTPNKCVVLSIYYRGVGIYYHGVGV
jgi:hypothetical protein